MPTPPRSWVCLCLAALLAACGGEPAAPVSDPSSQRELPAGKLVGFAGAYGNHAWRGIPYAVPPEGDLRWRAPRQAEPWDGVREALDFGSPCPQFASVYAGYERDASGAVGSEDCLYLDVYAPAFAPGEVPTGDARLPVLFWIHGGGNTIGNTGFYDGGNLAASQDVIVVAINYRLGPFGWFRQASLGGEGTSAGDRSGNYGTLDMIRALSWVQDNIAAFGGDPDRVSIFGESAGGGNVFSLMLSRTAAGLFHGAIIQSGGFDLATLDEAEALGADASTAEIVVNLMVADGSAEDRVAGIEKLAWMDDPDLAAYLRGKTPEELLAAYTGEDPGGMYSLPTRIRDGYVLPRQDPAGRVARGQYNRVPLMLGTNRDEDKIFMVFDPEYVDWRFGLIPAPKDADLYAATAEHQSNAWKARSVDAPATVFSAVQGPSVFAYRWDWDEEPSIPLLLDGAAMLGAAHGLEIPFVFGHFDLGPETRRLFVPWNRSGREALAAQMMSYWAEFAYSGNPGRGRAGDLPEWQAWSATDEPQYIVFDSPDDGGIGVASRTYTIPELVAAIAADDRLETAREKCSVLRNFVESDHIGMADYAQANGALCAQLALEAYPWHEVAAGGGGR